MIGDTPITALFRSVDEYQQVAAAIDKNLAAKVLLAWSDALEHERLTLDEFRARESA